MATTVANIRNCPAGWQNDPKYVYIAKGYFANPIVGDKTLFKYYDYAAARIHTDPKFAMMVLALEDKTMVCECAPKACHGDILYLLMAYLKREAKYWEGAPK